MLVSTDIRIFKKTHTSLRSFYKWLHVIPTHFKNTQTFQIFQDVLTLKVYKTFQGLTCLKIQFPT